MSKKINWGILGCGKIAHKFAQDLVKVHGAKLVSVASKSQERANTFDARYGAINSYGSYKELAEDGAIDIVYIATRHPDHYSSTMLCLEYNKHVLCEKPFGMDRDQVKKMIAMAHEKKRFLMEAMWTRFIPAIEKMKALIDQRLIGDIKIIQADFGYKANQDPNGRLYDKKLGGGSLLDIGIYPLFISLLTLGMPETINANAIFAETKVIS